MEAVGLKRDFGKDVVLWGGGCETQSVLRTASPAEVRDHVRRQVEALAPGGGFVFQQVHNILAGVPPGEHRGDVRCGACIGRGTGLGRRARTVHGCRYTRPFPNHDNNTRSPHACTSHRHQGGHARGHRERPCVFCGRHRLPGAPDRRPHRRPRRSRGGRSFIIVSSGAIALGLNRMGIADPAQGAEPPPGRRGRGPEPAHARLRARVRGGEAGNGADPSHLRGHPRAGRATSTSGTRYSRSGPSARCRS